MRIALLTLVLLGIAEQACQYSTAKNAETSAITIDLKLQEITRQIAHPSVMATDGSRLFVCEQEGRVWVIQNGKLWGTPFLDLQKMVVKRSGYEERGLLGLAFHPQFKENGKFYVYYSAPSDTRGSDHRSIVEEFKISAINPNLADLKSGRVLLTFEQPESNHNGGDIKFGHDGYLYISTGDGGGGGDRHGEMGNGQNINTLLGKILRIDVDKGSPYGIPPDNPFVGKPSTRPEIYAYGLRNPWRISFDSKTGKLFVGDVGQNQYEEIDIVEKGGNYGWRIMEGFHDYDRKQAKPANLKAPIAEYLHSDGISVTGGYVYRGNQIASLSGKYVFGDYAGQTYYLTENTNGTWTRGQLNFVNKPDSWLIYSFGEDATGEQYILAVLPSDDRGVIYKILTL